jgi:membrane dipeptidase
MANNRRYFNKLLGLGSLVGLIPKEHGLAADGQASTTGPSGSPPLSSTHPAENLVDGSGNPWLGYPPPPPADLLPVSAGVTSSLPSPELLTYKVALAPDQERRATALYVDSIVITGHDHCLERGDFEEMEAGGITVRNLEVLTDALMWSGRRLYSVDALADGWENRGRQAIELVDKQARESDGKIIIVRSVADIVRAKRDNKLGAIIGWEGARALGGQIENVKKFYDLGLRVQELYWYVPSLLKNADGTPNAIGIQVLQEMDRLGVVIDLSHLLGSAFEASLAVTQNPVVISHCRAAAVSENKPNNTGTDSLGDATIRAMGKNGGVMCLDIFQMKPHHGPHITVEDVVDHIYYVRSMVGIDHVALTANFMPNQYVYVGENSMRQVMPNIAREMVRRGFTDEEIQKVLGLNLMRVYQKVWKT